MWKTDKRFDCRQLLWKTSSSYLLPASHPPLRVNTPEQERQNQTEPTGLVSKTCSLALLPDHNFLNPYLCTHVCKLPFATPWGNTYRQIPTQPEGEEEKPIGHHSSALRRSVGVNPVSGCGGWGADPGTGGEPSLPLLGLTNSNLFILSLSSVYNSP